MIKAFKVLTSFSILPIIIFILFLSRIKFYTDDSGIPVTFKGKKGFLKGYFGKKRFFLLILHSRCFEITVLKIQSLYNYYGHK